MNIIICITICITFTLINEFIINIIARFIITTSGFSPILSGKPAESENSSANSANSVACGMWSEKLKTAAISCAPTYKVQCGKRNRESPSLFYCPRYTVKAWNTFPLTAANPACWSRQKTISSWQMAGVCIPFGIGVLSFPCQTVSSGNRAFSLYSSTLLLFSFLLFSSLLFSVG